MKKRVIIEDECGVIKYLQKLASEDYSCEHCAVAVASENNIGFRLCTYCMVQDVGGRTNEGSSTIPKKVSYALLKICSKERNVPVILHTHILGYEHSKPLEFSPQDMEFADKLAKVAKNMGNIPACGFIVMNGEDIACFFMNLRNEQCCDEEEAEYEFDKTGTVYDCL